MNCGATALLRQSASNGCGKRNHNGYKNNNNCNSIRSGNGMLLATQVCCMREAVKITTTTKPKAKTTIAIKTTTTFFANNSCCYTTIKQCCGWRQYVLCNNNYTRGNMRMQHATKQTK